MATTAARAEDLERLVSAGIKTDNDRWDFRYTVQKLNQGRAVIARNDYKVNHNWNPALVQFFYPDFEQYFQNNACITRFRIPTGFINADYSTTGLVYAGSADDATDNVYLAQNFLKINNRSELNDLINHPRLIPTNGVYNGILFEGLTVTVYGINKIKKLMVGGVFIDPTALPDFNVLKDEYPDTDDLFALIQTYVYQQAFGIEAAGTPQTLPNSTIAQPQSYSNMINKRVSR